jgi:curved DNA-binding protein CbpA
MAGVDYYRILGVPSSADAPTIRDAYLALVRRLHPDRVGAQGTARFQEITEAYQTLSDRRRRRAYDLARERAVPVYSPRSETLRTRPRPEPLIPEPLSVLDEPDNIKPSVEEVFERFIRNFTDFGSPKSEHVEGFDIGVILTKQEAARGAVCPWDFPC